MADTELLNTAQAAEVLGVVETLVRSWCRSGSLKAVRVEETRGPVWMVARADLVGFVRPRRGRPIIPAAQTL